MRNSTDGHYSRQLLLLILMVSIPACDRAYKKLVEKELETYFWGGWSLQPGSPMPTSGTVKGGDFYLERNYQGRRVTAYLKSTEFDSINLYQNQKVVFASQVAEKVSENIKDQKIVYLLINNMYYWAQFISVDGPEDGTGNDQLLVSDFVDTMQDLDKAKVYKYVRTNSGKRPW